VHAILRRRTDARGADASLCDLVMNEESHEVWRGGTPIKLTATEFNILRLFLRKPRKVLSKNQIMDHVWRYDFGGNPAIVEPTSATFRRRRNGLGPPLIQTIRLVGYVLPRRTRDPSAVAAGPPARRCRGCHAVSRSRSPMSPSTCRPLLPLQPHRHDARSRSRAAAT